jgi:ubiquinone biosynthesis protein UbiJ
MSALPRPITRTLNHVLGTAPLAMERLRRHAGRTAVVHVGPLTFAWLVQTTGLVEAAAAPEGPVDLRITISPFLLPRLAAGDETALREVKTEGDAEFAQDVAFLARNLSWDVEEDLSKVTGDIVAHRVVGGAKAAHAWSRDAAMRVLAGAAEYWTEEDPLIASRVKVEDFVREVSELREAVDRLEKRIERL